MILYNMYSNIVGGARSSNGGEKKHTSRPSLLRLPWKTAAKLHAQHPAGVSIPLTVQGGPHKWYKLFECCCRMARKPEVCYYRSRSLKYGLLPAEQLQRPHTGAHRNPEKPLGGPLTVGGVPKDISQQKGCNRRATGYLEVGRS